MSILGYSLVGKYEDIYYIKHDTVIKPYNHEGLMSLCRTNEVEGVVENGTDYLVKPICSSEGTKLRVLYNVNFDVDSSGFLRDVESDHGVTFRLSSVAVGCSGAVFSKFRHGYGIVNIILDDSCYFTRSFRLDKQSVGKIKFDTHAVSDSRLSDIVEYLVRATVIHNSFTSVPWSSFVVEGDARLLDYELDYLIFKSSELLHHSLLMRYKDIVDAWYKRRKDTLFSNTDNCTTITNVVVTNKYLKKDFNRISKILAEEFYKCIFGDSSSFPALRLLMLGYNSLELEDYVKTRYNNFIKEIEFL